jgi:hypothetical protein
MPESMRAASFAAQCNGRDQLPPENRGTRVVLCDEIKILRRLAQ